MTARLIVWGIAAAVLGVLLLTAYRAIEARGYDRAIRSIAVQDERAVKHANEARDSVRKCIADGGMYDQSTGQCVGR